MHDLFSDRRKNIDVLPTLSTPRRWGVLLLSALVSGCVTLSPESELDDAAIGQLVSDLEELERARAHDEAFGQWLEDETLRRFRLPVVVHGTALA